MRVSKQEQEQIMQLSETSLAEEAALFSTGSDTRPTEKQL